MCTWEYFLTRYNDVAPADVDNTPQGVSLDLSIHSVERPVSSYASQHLLHEARSVFRNSQTSVFGMASGMRFERTLARKIKYSDFYFSVYLETKFFVTV